MKRRHGFTLIELLVTGLLTSLLMIALLSLLRSTIQTNRQSDQLMRDSQSSLMLVEQMRRDLQNARGIRSSRNEIVLHGFLGTDERGEPTYQMSYVGYRIAPAGLVRWNSMGRNAESGDLVWSGATHLKVQLDAIDDEYEPSDTDKLQSGGLPMLPSRVAVSLTGGDRIIAHFAIDHHEDAI